MRITPKVASKGAQTQGLMIFFLSYPNCTGHGDHRNRRADEWNTYLGKLNIRDEMVSFLHHRFNVIFAIGGAVYSFDCS